LVAKVWVRGGDLLSPFQGWIGFDLDPGLAPGALFLRHSAALGNEGMKAIQFSEALEHDNFYRPAAIFLG
jgi:hypothetical protein